MADYNITVTIDPSGARQGGQVVNRQLNNIDRSSQTATRSMDDFSDSVALATGPMKALGVAVGVLGVALVALNLEQFRSQLVILADEAQISVSEFQKLATVFETVGIKANRTIALLVDLGKTASEYVRTGGGEFKDLFEQIFEPLGITIEQLEKMSTLDIFSTVIRGMDELKFNSKSLLFILETITEGSSALAPLLVNNGKKFKELVKSIENKGLVITEEESDALRKYNDILAEISVVIVGSFQKSMGFLANNIEILKDSFQTLVIIIGVHFARIAVPAAIKAMIILNAVIRANPIGALITVLVAVLVGFSDKILITSDNLTTLKDVGIATFEKIGSGISSVLESIKEVGRAILEYAMIDLGDASKEAQHAFRDWEFSFSGVVLAIATGMDTIIGLFIGTKDAIIIAWDEIPVKIKAIFVRLINNISKLINIVIKSVNDGIRNMIDKFRPLITAIVGSISDAQVPVIAAIKKMEEPVAESAIDIGIKMAEAIASGIQQSTAIEDTLREIKRRADEIASERKIIEPPTDEIEETKQKIGESTKSFSDGATDALNDYLKHAKDVSGQSKELFASAFKGSEDALVDFVMTGKADFKSLANSIIADIARMIIKQMVLNAVMQMFPALAGGAGAGAGAAAGAGAGAAAGASIAVSTGGLITGPGGPRDDLIPANLSDGEFVINAKSTKQFQPLLEAINSGKTGTIRTTKSPTFSGSRTSSNHSNDVIVQVFDQRSSRDSDQVETRQSTNTDGRRMIQIMITDTVKRAAENGMLDNTMSNRFGITRTTMARG